MKGCLKVLVIVVVAVVVLGAFFDFLDWLIITLDKIPWWVWIGGIILFLAISSKSGK